MNIVVNHADSVEIPDNNVLLSVLVPSANVHSIRYPGRVPITIEMTVYHAERVKKLHAETEALVDRALEEWQLQAMRRWITWKDKRNAGHIASLGTGVLHVIGLIDLVLKLQDQNVPIVLVHPESGLHPSIVLKLTDVLLYLAERGADEEMRFERLSRLAEIKS